METAALFIPCKVVEHEEDAVLFSNLDHHVFALVRFYSCFIYVGCVPRQDVFDDISSESLDDFIKVLVFSATTVPLSLSLALVNALLWVSLVHLVFVTKLELARL